MVDNNTLNAYGYTLSFSRELEDDKRKQFVYNIQSFTLPDVDTDPIEQKFQGHPIHMPGDYFSNSGVTFKFVCDENMEAYNHIYNWIKSNMNSGKVERVDIILSVVSSSNNVIRQFKFTEAFPKSISGMEMEAWTDSPEPYTLDVNFVFSAMEFSSDRSHLGSFN